MMKIPSRRSSLPSSIIGSRRSTTTITVAVWALTRWRRLSRHGRRWTHPLIRRHAPTDPSTKRRWRRWRRWREERKSAFVVVVVVVGVVIVVVKGRCVPPTVLLFVVVREERIGGDPLGEARSLLVNSA